MKQLTTMQEYLIHFNKSAAESPSLMEEEKTLAFVKNLLPETSDLVSVRRPRNMKEAIEEAVRIEALQAERQRGGRSATGESSVVMGRPLRPEGRRSFGVETAWEPRHIGYGKGPHFQRGPRGPTRPPFGGGKPEGV